MPKARKKTYLRLLKTQPKIYRCLTIHFCISLLLLRLISFYLRVSQLMLDMFCFSRLTVLWLTFLLVMLDILSIHKLHFKGLEIPYLFEYAPTSNKRHPHHPTPKKYNLYALIFCHVLFLFIVLLQSKLITN